MQLMVKLRIVKERSIINVKLASNENLLRNQSLFEMDIKTKLYARKKQFANDLVAIPKNKVIFMLNKTAYVVMCILDMNKVLMYEYHNDYIKNKCDNN